jgi:hypothetical protein
MQVLCPAAEHSKSEAFPAGARGETVSVRKAVDGHQLKCLERSRYAEGLSPRTIEAGVKSFAVGGHQPTGLGSGAFRRT